MAKSKTFHRRLRICCLTSAITLIIIIITLLILYFTLLKPKDPIITPQPVTLKSLRFTLPPAKPSFNITLGILLTVENKNYGSFKYKASKAYVSYRGDVVGEAPIVSDTVPARGKHNVTSAVTVFADKLLGNTGFMDELLKGVVNFTSASTLHGIATVLKIFKARATSLSTCDISVFVWTQQTQSVCKCEIKLN